LPYQSQEALGLIENWGDMICTPSNSEAPATKADLNGNTADDRPLILLIKDSKIIHTFFGNVLRESPYRLISAYDGDEGYRIAIERMPDLIMYDIDMPHLNGYEMCHQIKET